MNLTEFQTTIREHELVLAYCSTPTCNVCKILKPQVRELISEMKPWEFIYVDMEQSPEISGQLLVFAVPTLILFVQGREQTRLSRHFGLGELQGRLERYRDLIS